MLYAAGLRRGGLDVHARLDGQPLEEAMTFERRRRAALALICKAHVVAEHADEAGSAEVRERLGDARLGDTHMLREVDVAAAPALGADGEDCLEVILR